MSGKTGGKPRKHPGVRGRRPDRKEARRESAEARQAARDEMSAVAQLHRLDGIFGKGKGARCERDRLLAKVTRAA